MRKCRFTYVAAGTPRLRTRRNAQPGREPWHSPWAQDQPALHRDSGETFRWAIREQNALREAWDQGFSFNESGMITYLLANNCVITAFRVPRGAEYCFAPDDAGVITAHVIVARDDETTPTFIIDGPDE